MLGSISRTQRLLVVEEGPRIGGLSTGLLRQVTERGLHDLDDAWIVATDETTRALQSDVEDALMPDAAQITAEVLTAASTP